MSDDALLADANLAELARLRSELSDARQALAQAERATEAERRSRQIAGANSGALHLAIERLLAFVTSGRYLPDEDRALIERALTNDRPGASLLTELDAARAVVAHVRDYQQAIANLNGIMPAETALWVALSAYDQATKARDA